MTGSRPLEGVRVLDASRLLPGPFATMVLADLGAQVDKLEDAAGGDYLRVTAPFVDDGMGAMYHAVNRGKRSLVLDLKKPGGKEALLRLAKSYDVYLESNRPGVADRLGVGYAALSEANPRIVYCAITGYGQDGPLKDRAGHDLNYLSRAGVLGFTGPADRPPTPPGVQMADISGGLYGVIGILAALQGRDRAGRGAFVDISMQEAALTLATFGFGCHVGGLRVPRGEDVLMGGIAPYNTYATKDGGSMSIGALEPKFWQAFCEATGFPFDMRDLMPGPHQAVTKPKLAELFASRTRAAWTELSQKVDCCLEPVLDAQETIDDPHLRARGVWSERETHKGGTVTVARTPVAPAAEGKAPRQGQDGEAILRDAGFGDEEIAALRAGQVTR